MTVLEAILISVFTSVAAAWITSVFYGRQVKADLQKEYESRFNQRKWDSYTEFTDIVYQVLQDTKNPKKGTQERAQARMHQCVSRLWIQGGDGVIRALNDWLRLSRRAESLEQTEDAAKVLFKMVDVLIEMRKDLGYTSSKISAADLLTTFVTDAEKYLGDGDD